VRYLTVTAQYWLVPGTDPSELYISRIDSLIIELKLFSINRFESRLNYQGE